MAWPKEIAHGGRGSGRMSQGDDNKRRFIQDVVLAMINKDPKFPSRDALRAHVDMADELYGMIKEKCR